MGTQKNRFPKRHQRQTVKQTGYRRAIQLFKLYPVLATFLTLILTYSGGQATKYLLNKIIENQHTTKKTITDYTTISTTLLNTELRDKLQAKMQTPINPKEILFPEQEIAIYNQLVEETRLPEAYVMRAMFWAANGQIELAMDDLNTAEDKAPECSYIYTGHGIVHLIQRQFDKAEKYFRKALEYNPIDWSAYQQIINIYLFSNRPQQAIKLLNKRIAVCPQDTLSRLTLCRAFLEAKAFTEARNIVIPILEHNPNSALGHLYLGNINHMEQNYADAITHYNLAETCNQAGIKFLCMINRADIYFRTGDYPQAEQTYLRLHELCPNETMSLEQLSHIAIIHKKYDLAEQYLGKIQTIDPTAKNYGDKLQVCFKLYGVDSAIRLSEHWLRNHSDDPDAIHAAAFMKSRTGKWLEASRLHHRILDMDPTNTTAALELAHIAYDKGDARQGINWCNKALRIDSLNFNGFHLRGLIYYFLCNDITHALLDFKTCIRLKPENAQAHFGCGICQLSQRNIESAIAHFNKSYTLDSLFYRAMIEKSDSEIAALKSHLHLTKNTLSTRMPTQEDNNEFESYFHYEPSQTNYLIMNNAYAIRITQKN